MIPTKGKAGTGNIIQAVRQARQVQAEMDAVKQINNAQLAAYALKINAPVHLLKGVRATNRLPVVMFSVGGGATPTDATLMMQLGMDRVWKQGTKESP